MIEKQENLSVEETLLSFKGKVSDNTLKEALMMSTNASKPFHKVFLEGKDIVFEGGAKGTVTVKHRD